MFGLGPVPNFSSRPCSSSAATRTAPRRRSSCRSSSGISGRRAESSTCFQGLVDFFCACMSPDPSFNLVRPTFFSELPNQSKFWSQAGRSLVAVLRFYGGGMVMASGLVLRGWTDSSLFGQGCSMLGLFLVSGLGRGCSIGAKSVLCCKTWLLN